MFACFRMFWEHGSNTYAQSNMRKDWRCCVRQLQSGEVMADLFGDTEGNAGIGFRQNDGKFFAARTVLRDRRVALRADVGGWRHGSGTGHRHGAHSGRCIV